LYLADCFRLSARNLFEDATKDDSKDIRRYGPGCVVLGAFSVKLYLKCLLSIECDQYPGSHDLKELFCQLKRETRDELRKRHDASPTRPGNLDEMLERGGDTFNKVRYLFEHRDQIQFGLNWFGELIRQKILSLHPDWEADDATFQFQ
jgi:hypothetical protein